MLESTNTNSSLNSTLSEWLRVLDGSSQALDLPAPPLLGSDGAAEPRPVEELHLPSTTVDSQDRCLAGLATLLHRYSDQDRFCVGLLEDTREGDRIFPLAVDFRDNPAFSSMVVQVRAGRDAAIAQGGIPVAEIGTLADERLGEVPSFVQVLVRLSGDGERSAVPDVPFELLIELVPMTDGVRMTIRVGSGRMDASLCARLPGHLSTLLEAAARDQETPIGELPLLTAEERRQILVEWGCGPELPRVEECIQQFLEQAAAGYSDRVALLYHEERVTFAEMNRRANRLAHWLRAQGARPGRRVALLLSQSAEAVIGVLAVLKSGAAYVGLPLASPPEHLGLLLQETDPLLVLTRSDLRARLPAASPAFSIDRDLGQLADWPDHNPELLNGPDDDAFVLFTSGSTGTPKAVVGTHRGSVNRWGWWTETYAATLGECVTCLRASVSVLPFLHQFFWPLAGGATVLIIPEEDSRDPQRLIELAGRHGVAHMMTPSSLMGAMLEMAPDLRQRLPQVRIWQCGAEVLPPEQARRFQATVPGCRLVLAYGSTETSTGITAFDTAGLTERHVRIPVGRPIRNCQVYVLDRYRQPVPAGVRGDVYVGGECLTRGYLHGPEAFLPNPLPEGRSEQLYRMGDLGRFLPDGNLELVGRSDHQVKIRGFRIELAEVEAALMRHPLVREAVVLVRSFGDDPRLVAYFAATPEHTPLAGELRDFLRVALPNYMVPAAFHALPALPRLPAGKLDRRSLPNPEMTRPALEAAYSAPQGEIEVRLAGIWEEVLRVQPVGREDDFFDLGGHSLLVMRVISRVRESFQRGLEARDLFEHRTVAALALQLEDRSDAAVGARLGERTLPISYTAPGARRLLSFAQRRLWFLDQLEQDSAAFNEALHLRFQGSLNVDCLGGALNEVTARHAILRSRYLVADGEPYQVADDVTDLPLPLTDLSNDPEADAEACLPALLRMEADRQFRLETGPVLQARLFRLASAEHVLSLVIHHIATDGWSMNLLVDELRLSYESLCQRHRSPLRALPVQYADFAAWQRREADFTAELAYWTDRLNGAPRLELPLDFARPTLPRHEGAQVKVDLGPELTQAIERTAREGKATPFMVLLAAFASVLGRWTGAEDLVIGAPVTDRPFPETESLIGVFLNNLCLRINLSGNPSFEELLGQVRAVSLEAYANQKVPFERIVEAMRVERDTARHPVFEVMCNHLSAPQASLEFTGMEVSRIPPVDPRSKLPMTLYSRMAEGALTLRLVYQRSLFLPARMEALLAQLQWLLTQVTTSPERSLAELSLATPEAETLLADPTIRLAAELLPTVLEELALRAVEKPDAPAVSWRGRAWSYRDVVTSVEALAFSVAGRVSPGMVVAVTGERSFGLVTAMLAVFRAGAVLLTLDPALPAARRLLMLSEAGCGLLVSVGPAASEGLAGIETLQLDLIEPAKGLRPSSEGATQRANRDAAAYVFYTSGSTGKPKAVLGTHAGLAHFVSWQRTEFAIGPGDRCALLTGLSFDVLLRDVFLPLTAGATLCIPEAGDTGSGAAVFSWLKREGISTLHAVPSLTRHWIATHNGTCELPQLRYVFLAGEPLRDDLVASWRRSISSDSTLVNLYGPTETTLAKFCYPVPAMPEVGLQPVGWPLPQTQVLVLTPSGSRCGMYEPGEIAIRTPFRTRGYLNSPEETRCRFQTNPLRPQADNDLVYFTGDRGYLRPDGALVVLGRMDEQLKLRGVRIEPGEIEAALQQHPLVLEAAVDLRRSSHGEAFLAAYLVCVVDEAPTPSALRRFLLGVLPAALVPTVFTRVEHLPRSANGKLLRASLPDPVAVEQQRPEPAPPRDDVERQLVWIWQDLLRRSEVGVHDNFFDLGGHSLLAVQLLGRIQQTFRRELPLASLIQSSTIAEIAERLREGVKPPETSVLVALQSVGAAPPLFAVHGIGGGVLCYRALARRLGEGRPFYALQAPALAGEAPTHLGIEEMAERYVAEVRRVQASGPYYLLGLSFGGNIALEMAQRLMRDGEHVALLGMLDSKGPGYPRFPSRWSRAWAHCQYFLKQPPAGRRHYLSVRVKGARDLIRRRVLHSWFRRAHCPEGALAGVLDDIGISHIQAGREYERQPYPGAITVFRASLQPIGCIPEWDNGWSRVAQGGVTVHQVPGEHAEIVDEPHVAVLAEHLKRMVASG